MAELAPNTFAMSMKWYDRILGDPESEWLCTTLKSKNVETVCELGCGTGAWTAKFAESFDVTGVDINKEALAVAETRVPTARFVLGDMRTYRKEKFDAVVIMRSSLLLLATIEDIAATVKNVADHLLEDGGVLVLDLPNHAIEIPFRNRTQDHWVSTGPDWRVDVVVRTERRGNFFVESWFGFGCEGSGNYSQFSEEYAEFILPTNEPENLLRRANFHILHEFASLQGDETTGDKRIIFAGYLPPNNTQGVTTTTTTKTPNY